MERFLFFREQEINLGYLKDTLYFKRMHTRSNRLLQRPAHCSWPVRVAKCRSTVTARENAVSCAYRRCHAQGHISCMATGSIGAVTQINMQWAAASGKLERLWHQRLKAVTWHQDSDCARAAEEVAGFTMELLLCGPWGLIQIGGFVLKQVYGLLCLANCVLPWCNGRIATFILQIIKALNPRHSQPPCGLSSAALRLRCAKAGCHSFGVCSGALMVIDRISGARLQN